jgi:hypothetical protein
MATRLLLGEQPSTEPVDLEEEEAEALRTLAAVPGALLISPQVEEEDIQGVGPAQLHTIMEEVAEGPLITVKTRLTRSSHTSPPAT